MRPAHALRSRHYRTDSTTTHNPIACASPVVLESTNTDDAPHVGWKLRITSTPNGKGNKFYELITGRDETWSRHVVDIHRAVADGLPRDIEALRAAINDDDAWSQEFELQFLDEATAWLPFDLISSVEHEDAGRPELYQGGRCFLGVDIGRRRDLFVIWVFEEVGDVLWTREIVELKAATFAEQDTARDQAFDRYRVVRSDRKSVV